MLRFLLRALVAALGFWVASKILSGVHVRGIESLIAAGLVLGVVNALVRPVLVVLTLPLTVVTLGLFLLVINGITVWLVTLFIHGVRIDGPLAAILTALIVGLTSWAASGLIEDLAGKRA